MPAMAPRRLPGSVLFVCNFNVIRSVMAEHLMRLRFGKSVWVDSCGIRKGGERDPFVTAVLDEVGADATRHRPKTLAELEDESFDLIVSLTPEAHHRALEFTRTLGVDVVYWPTMDPTLVQGSREQRLDEYRAVRDSLSALIAQSFIRPSTQAAQ
jgi:protein-tyrosine-phosphatase